MVFFASIFSFFTYSSDSLKSLYDTIQDPKAHETDDNILTTENAVSAFAKICEGQGLCVFEPVVNSLESHVPLNQALPFWLSCLPIIHDESEARYCCNYLCKLVELCAFFLSVSLNFRSNPFIIGDSMRNIPQIIQIFGSFLDAGVVSSDLEARISGILHAIQAQVPSDFLAQAWSALSAAQRESIQKILH